MPSKSSFGVFWGLNRQTLQVGVLLNIASIIIGKNSHLEMGATNEE